MILFDSPPDGSAAHYLLDGPLVLFPTLDSLGLLDNFGELRENGTDLSQVRMQQPTSGGKCWVSGPTGTCTPHIALQSRWWGPLSEFPPRTSQCPAHEPC